MKQPRLDPRLLRQPVHFFALGFGAGLSPVAPGTVGTIIAVPLVMAIAAGGQWLLFAFACIAFGAGIYLCGESARRLGVHDHPGIVWDEVAGFAVTMLAAPPGWHHTWTWAFAGFLLFRLFDIWKPWPIREADHSLTGGLGIMLDDILAGVFSALLLFAYRHFF